MGWASLLSFKAELNEVLHPGKSARIYLGETPVGWLGVLHPRLADAFDVAFDVMLFELSLDELPSAVSSRYQPISKYPSIRRDLSLLVDEQIPAGDIEHLVRQVVSEHQLKAFNVFDHYAGEGIPQGKKSIAIAMTLQNEGCTLTDGEINTIIDAILEALRDKLAIILRD